MPFDGEAYKKRRKALGMSAYDVSVKVQETVQESRFRPEYVSHYEHARRQPSLDVFMGLVLAVDGEPLAFWKKGADAV